MTSNYLLHQAIERHALTTPDNIAVRFGKEQLTYLQLYEKSNQLAQCLRAHGARHGDRVGIFMFKNIHSALAIYGILSAGCAYVPLDPFAPLDRLQHVIENCDIHILVSHDRKSVDIQDLAARIQFDAIVGLSDPLTRLTTISWPEVFDGPTEALKLHLTEQDLAYILYTSGSTGLPKGIVHTHRSGLSFANWALGTYQLKANDRISNHAPLHFDLSTFDFFASALAGATTCIIPEAVTKFPVSMAKWIQDEEITVWYSVPYALIQMMQRAKLSADNFSHLRWILFAGEPFPTKHLRELMQLLPHTRFSNLYGPTETNVCTFYHVPTLASDSDEPIPIGIACENIEDLVVDAEGQAVPAGENGELLIRGGVVMKGYWGSQELTSRGFYDRPVTNQFFDRFYRTGDLVQKREDGNYRFLGRKDRQVKTRGYRVELDEIENALLAIPDVQEAAVYPIADGEGSSLIKAAVIPKLEINLTEDVLFAELGRTLPPYAIPVEIEIRSEFPRTSTGKIDRRALQAAKK